MDDVLHRINSDCISLSKDAKRRNNRVLNEVVTAIVERMQQRDRLFAELYQETFYGGSYYDDLKVAKPDEYDLDLVMRFPEDLRCRLVESDCPGFVRLRIDNPQLLGHNFQVKLMEGCYLSAQKLSDWMEALIHSILCTAGDYTLTARMIRPAMILVVTDVYKRTILTVDLVPCFRFDFDKLPGSKWRSNPVRSSKTFSIVPKRSENSDNLSDLDWGLSFQEQERELISDKRNLKPVMKLVKRLRDISGHTTITSYYIKTIFLWVNERCGPTFWDGALSDVFLTMLRIYIRYLRSGRIPYFWNYGLNLLDIDPTTLSDITRRLLDISTSIESNRYSNPQLVCKYLGCEMVRLLDRTIVVCIESPLFSSSFI